MTWEIFLLYKIILQSYTTFRYQGGFFLLLLFFGPPVHVQRHKEQDKEQKKNKTAVMGSINILTMEVPDNIACELQHINQFCAAGSNLSSEKSIAAKSQYLWHKSVVC